MMIGNPRTSKTESSSTISHGTMRREADRHPATSRDELFAVVIHDDDVHTCRDYIETLQEIFGYSQPRAYELTQELAQDGKVAVWKGPREEAIRKAERTQEYRPRWRRGESVTAPRWVDTAVPPLTITVVLTSPTKNESDSKATSSARIS